MGVSVISVFDFVSCFEKKTRFITEAAIGLRVSNEYGIVPDKSIQNASLVYDAEGRRVLREIYGQYLQVARAYDLPVILFTNTRRANRDRVYASAFKDKNIMRDYATFLREVAADFTCQTFIGGYIGCKGDGYTGEGCLATEDAAAFHSWQVEAFEEADVDVIMASLMPTLDESIGMAQALQKSRFPYLFSFMVRENGTISDGTTIGNAIRAVDTAVDKKPLCYLSNCVHPRILLHALQQNDTPVVRERFKGIQANAAYMPPEALDKPSETVTSTAQALADEMTALNNEFPMQIIGGCCGTDATHLRAFAHDICKAKGQYK